MNRIFKTLQKLVLAGVAASMISGLILVFPSAPVFAAAGNQSSNPPAAQTTPPGQKVSQKERLQKRFKQEQKALVAQGKQIDRATALVNRAQKLIDRALAKGWPVEVLQTALEDFKDALTSAAKMHAGASQIVSAHGGFNANGMVTNAGQARQTVFSAAESLLESHQVLSNAFTDLLKEVTSFRKSFRPGPKAMPAPASGV